MPIWFQVEVKRNLSHQEMHQSIGKFAGRLDHGDMSVLVILSHGDNGIIYSSDGRHITNEWILKQFNNYNCPGEESRLSLGRLGLVRSA